MGVYLRAKFEVYSVILTGFKQGVVLPPSPPQDKPLKSPPGLGLMHNVPKWLDTLQKSCRKCCKTFKVCLTIFGRYALKG